MKLLDHIFDLQNYFKLKKIPYIFYNALPNYLLSDIPDFKTVYNAIDLKRFYKPETSHYEFCIKKKLFISKEDTHPNTEGHRQWALLLKKYIAIILAIDIMHLLTLTILGVNAILRRKARNNGCYSR